MLFQIVTPQQIEQRNYWIDTIGQLGTNFEVASEKIEQLIDEEIKIHGLDALLGHLRLCGTIPEKYGYDTSTEKLYSKYTDIVIHQTYKQIGLISSVIKERSGVADVECLTDDYSFVADAKAFRLSRTAKNQKDFKVQSMDNWKHGKLYAMIVCPSYQLPSRTSQIYQQATTKTIYITTYSHLAVMAKYAQISGQHRGTNLLHEIFKTIEAANPSKDAYNYWQMVNRTMLDFDSSLSELWRIEKEATIESIQIAQNEALHFLTTERERILKLSQMEAIKELLRLNKIDNKINVIQSVRDNGLLGIG